jgi:hypothetical protein
MNLCDVAEEQGVFFNQYARPVSEAKGKQPKYPKIIHFNAPRAQIFVSTILDAPESYGPVLVRRKDGNISGLNKGKAIERLSLALGQVDSFKVLDDSGQPKNGVNSKLINSFVEKVFFIVEKVGIHVKKGGGVKELAATGKSEPDHSISWSGFRTNNWLRSLCSDTISFSSA